MPHIELRHSWVRTIQSYIALQLRAQTDGLTMKFHFKEGNFKLISAAVFREAPLLRVSNNDVDEITRYPLASLELLWTISNTVS